MTQTRHIAHAEGWLAVATEPDLCKVGKCVVAFNSFAWLDQQYAASPDVKARGTPVYRVGDLFRNTQANAGAHIVSGTALGTGYLQILEGHSNVKINAIPVARHDSACRINCDSTGMGGARGQIVTMTKTIAPALAKPAAAPRVSKKLLELKALRDALSDGRMNLDATDGFIDFDRTNAMLSGWISEVQGTPGTASDWDAQLGRAGLGVAKEFVMGVSELAYEVVKGVPKLARDMTPRGNVIAGLDRQILAEEVRLGNIEAPSITKNLVGMAKAIVKPVIDPWMKGQYVESGARAGIEVLTFWSLPSKATRAAKAKELLDLAKAKAVQAAADKAVAAAAQAAADMAAAAAARAAADKAASALADATAAKAVVPVAAKVAYSKASPAPMSGGGLYIKDRARLAKKISAATRDREKLILLSNEADEAAKAANKAKAAGDKVLAAKLDALAEAKIQEGRNLLRRFVDNGDLQALLDRLEVASPKDGAHFWSGWPDGALDRAREMADKAGGVSLESTAGGRIMNDWARVNTSDIPAIKDGLWAGLSKNYAAGAEGAIKIVQSDSAFLSGGGYIWKNVELPEIIRQGRVTTATIVDLSGNVRATFTFDELKTMNLKNVAAAGK